MPARAEAAAICPDTAFAPWGTVVDRAAARGFDDCNTRCDVTDSPAEHAAAYSRKFRRQFAPSLYSFVMSKCRIELTTAMCCRAREKITFNRFSPPR